MVERTTSLTFEELRLANLCGLVSSGQAPGALSQETLQHALTEILADMVIRIDRVAARANIDLAAAIRSRFAEPDSNESATSARKPVSTHLAGRNR